MYNATAAEWFSIFLLNALVNLVNLRMDNAHREGSAARYSWSKCIADRVHQSLALDRSPMQTSPGCSVPGQSAQIHQSCGASRNQSLRQRHRERRSDRLSVRLW